jgi:hypothetical protein
MERSDIMEFNMLTTEFNLKDAQTAWLKEGIEIGVEKGREELRRAIANMRAKGVDEHNIAEFIGCDVEYVRRILKEGV